MWEKYLKQLQKVMKGLYLLIYPVDHVRMKNEEGGRAIGWKRMPRDLHPDLLWNHLQNQKFGKVQQQWFEKVQEMTVRGI